MFSEAKIMNKLAIKNSKYQINGIGKIIKGITCSLHVENNKCINTM